MYKSAMVYVLELAKIGLFTSVSKPAPDRTLTIRMFDGYGNTTFREVPLDWWRSDNVDEMLIDVMMDMRGEMTAIHYEHDIESYVTQDDITTLKTAVRMDIPGFGFYTAASKKKKKKGENKALGGCKND